MAPGGEMFRYLPRFGENVLRHGSHEWLPYSKNAVRAKSSNTNLSGSGWILIGICRYILPSAKFDIAVYLRYS